MAHFVGLDVSVKETSVRVVDDPLLISAALGVFLKSAIRVSLKTRGRTNSWRLSLSHCR